MEVQAHVDPERSNIGEVAPLLRSTATEDCTTGPEALKSNGWQFDVPFDSGNSMCEFGSGSDNFASWLFGTPNSRDVGFDPDSMPFCDSGLDWSPIDAANMFAAPLPEQGDTGIVGGSQDISLVTLPSRPPYLRVDATRHREICDTLGRFTRRHRCYGAESSRWPDAQSNGLPEFIERGFEDYIDVYWRNVAPYLPVIHRATFSASECPIMLLLAMIALGSARLVLLKPKGSAKAHAHLANVIATALRWEVCEHEDAQPPIELWVAQSLVLVEFFEKIHSTRHLHERAHIGHSYTLNLLRRGDPMVARSGSESPQQGATEPSSPQPPVHALGSSEPNQPAWWIQWARNESMRRVVFAAFKMDIFHAVMFGEYDPTLHGWLAGWLPDLPIPGHNADLAPYELRLALPCDDSMWTANSADETQRMQELLAFHGLKTLSFLDALKLTLHGQEVHTHVDGRTILFAGLLSVGWHISRRERGLQFLETPRPSQEQRRWNSTITQALSIWRHSFENVLHRFKHRGQFANGIEDPNLLFHFANIVLHVDIVDCQILAQIRRLFGRKVSSRDATRVTQRMRNWAATSTGELAVFHAFRLLSDTGLKRVPVPGAAPVGPPLPAAFPYSCRSDMVAYWPWTMYLAALTIWAYEYLSVAAPHQPSPTTSNNDVGSGSCWDYLQASRQSTNPSSVHLLRSRVGCKALLHTLSDDFSNAESELLIEAAASMRHCAYMLENQRQDG